LFYELVLRTEPVWPKVANHNEIQDQLIGTAVLKISFLADKINIENFSSSQIKIKHCSNSISRSNVRTLILSLSWSQLNVPSVT
jgi:hypothetical protein